ncbi:hypothetical protein IWZ01DRAFT_478215 [Phyllosticta capitalensis]|uniref:Uncharacterized protein n=1 Tax=Phyllosticta capitalensis TaxID=121624 RepID=A0ABR1Z369_9PEZI
MPDNFDTLSGIPLDFFRSDALQACEGFSCSPHLAELELSRVTTSAATLIRVLENTSSTLRELTLNLVIISPFKECGGTFWRQNIEPLFKSWRMRRQTEDFPIGETFWEDILLPLPNMLPNLSSVCLGDLLDSRPHYREMKNGEEVWHARGPRWLFTDTRKGFRNQTAVHDYLLRRLDLMPGLEAQNPAPTNERYGKAYGPCDYFDDRDYLKSSSVNP